MAGVFGYKFEDLNANGIDDGEPRLPGVEVSVLVDDGINTPFTLTDITDAAGEYQFEDLPAATMTVTETPPLGSFQTTPDPAPFFLNSVENAVAFAGQSGQAVETVIPELAFGNAFLGSIHGFKFEDIDGNGIYDPNTEPPLGNVTFTLRGNTGLGTQITATVRTDTEGRFWFTDLLPGSYSVTETVPAGFVQTTSTIRNFTLESRQEFVWQAGEAMLPPDDPRVEVVVGNQLVFGNTVPGSIHGFKFEDIDGNGVYDPFVEPPLANVSFTLEGITGLGTTLTRTTTSDSNGNFWFTGLMPGIYAVTENVTPGFEATTPRFRFLTINSREELVWQPGAAQLPTSGDPRREVLVGDQLIFGNAVPGSIHGFKFNDLNLNGVYEPNLGEPPLSGVEFTLTGTDGLGNPVNQQVVTDANGEFWFTDLLPSVAGPGGPATGYTVTETVPQGFVPTTPTQQTFDLFSRIEFVWEPGAADLPANDPRFEVLANGINGPSLLFGNAQVVGSIHGFKFEDVDANGIYDPLIDTPAANVEFTLTGNDLLGNTVAITTTTDPLGNFWFTDVMASDAAGYTVTETVPTGWVPTTPTTFNAVLVPGQELVAFPGQAMLQVDSEAEAGTGDGSIMTRANASGGETVQLDAGESRTLSFNVMSDRTYDVDIRYSNDNFGPLETVEVSIDGMFVGAFLAQDTGDFGEGWEIFVSDMVGSVPLAAGAHTMTITVFGGDGFGIEVDLASVTAVDVEEVVVGTPLQFGNTVPGSIHGFKFEDIDGNGIYDPTFEPPLGRCPICTHRNRLYRLADNNDRHRRPFLVHEPAAGDLHRDRNRA